MSRSTTGSASAASRSAPTRPVAVPDLSRRPFLEGQVAVQDEHRRRRSRGRGRRRTAADGRAATSTSRPARSSSAAGCGIRIERSSRPARAVVDRGVGAASRSTTRRSSRPSAHVGRRPPEPRARRASRRTTREAELLKLKDVTFGRQPVGRRRRSRPVCPTSSPMRSRPRCRSSACSDRCPPDERGRHGRRRPTRNPRRPGPRRYNQPDTILTPTAGRQRPPPAPEGPRPMTQTAATAADRPHRAAKRYIYAWGGGHAEGDATMRDLLGGKGAGLAEMTNAGPAGPARLHDHDRGLQRLLRGRRAAARRPVGRRPRGGPRGRGGRPARASATRPTRSSCRSARAPSSRCPG